MSKTDDQLAKIRQTRYTAAAVIAAAGPALAVALAQGGVDKWIAVAIAVAGVFTGAAGSAYAAKNTRSQRADGQFDPTPEPLSPAEQIINGYSTLSGVQAQVVADIGKVAEVAKTAFGTIGAVGPVTYNIQARDTEDADAFIRAHQQRDASLAAQVIGSVGGGR